jgi:hypothetical protein
MITLKHTKIGTILIMFKNIIVYIFINLSLVTKHNKVLLQQA